MASLEVRRLIGEAGDAANYRQILRSDYLRLGIEREDIDKINPEYDEELVATSNRMSGDTIEYYGAYRDKRLAGVATLGTWLYGDDVPFVSTMQTTIARGLHKLHHLRGEVQIENSGIFSFGIDTRLEEYEDIALPFLAALRARAIDRQSPSLVAAIDIDDSEMLDAYERAGGVRSSHTIGRLAIRGVSREYYKYSMSTTQ